MWPFTWRSSEFDSCIWISEHRFICLNNLHILSFSHSIQVAALATLAILRVIAASSSSKDNENVSIKCITFSQPPVGNAALKEQVFPVFFSSFNFWLTAYPFPKLQNKDISQLFFVFCFFFPAMLIEKVGSNISRVTAFQKIWFHVFYLLLIFTIIMLRLCQGLLKMKLTAQY